MVRSVGGSHRLAISREISSPLEWILNLAGRHQLDPPDAGLDAALLCAAADLPLIHRDPFDRVLVAMAQRDGLTILTSDRLIPKYPDIVSIW